MHYAKLTGCKLKKRSVMDLLFIDPGLFNEGDKVKSLLIIALLYNTMQVGIKMGEKEIFEIIFQNGSLVAWIMIAGGGQLDMLFKYLYRLSAGTGGMRNEARDVSLRVCDMMEDGLFFEYGTRLVSDFGGSALCATMLKFAETRLCAWDIKVCKFFECLIFAVIKV
jgi:hypothetical protein